jgi:hypothetical protein
MASNNLMIRTEILNISSSTITSLVMAPVPTPLDFSELQPFKTVRDNWAALKPYHDNYITTISFMTVATAFLGTVGLMVKHGFKFPRLHPAMEVEELPSSLEHENQYIGLDDLIELKIYEFEERESRWRDMEPLEGPEQEDAEKERGENEIPGVPSDTKMAEDNFKETSAAGMENAMDMLDEEGIFDAESDRD